MNLQPRISTSRWPLVALGVLLLGLLLWDDAHRRHLEADAFEAALAPCVQAGEAERVCAARIEPRSRRCFRAAYQPSGKGQREAFHQAEYQACVLGR